MRKRRHRWHGGLRPKLVPGSGGEGPVTRAPGDPSPPGGADGLTELGRAVASEILKTFSRAVGREITPEELQAAHRALRQGTRRTDAESVLFLLDYLRGT